MTLDTNIIIGYLKEERPIFEALSQWRQEGRHFILPTIVEAEVLSFSPLTPQEQLRIETFLRENFLSVSFDRAVAKIAASIRREQKIKFPDAAIAATALYTHTPLVTRNVKDFQRVKGLRVVSL